MTTKAMTSQQQAQLQALIDEVETKYFEFLNPEAPVYQLSHFKSVEAAIFAYVNSLLAEKDAQIAALKGQGPALLDDEDDDALMSRYEAKIAAEEMASLANPDGLGQMDLDDYRACVGLPPVESDDDDEAFEE